MSLQIAHVIHFFFTAADFIFTGLKSWIPLLFILNLLLKNLFTGRVIIATNNLLLTGGMLFALAFAADLLTKFNSTGNDNADFMREILSGPHWYQYVFPIIIYLVLPQVEWSRKIRSNIFISLFIVVTWIITYIIIYYLSRPANSILGKPAEMEINYAYCIMSFFSVAAVALGYGIISTRKMR
jgi:hypothetical protein